MDEPKCQARIASSGSIVESFATGGGADDVASGANTSFAFKAKSFRVFENPKPPPPSLPLSLLRLYIFCSPEEEEEEEERFPEAEPPLLEDEVVGALVVFVLPLLLTWVRRAEGCLAAYSSV